jgi:hypothetical protein
MRVKETKEETERERWVWREARTIFNIYNKGIAPSYIFFQFEI